MEKVEMAQGQLHFICYAAEEIIDFIKKGGEVEEWYQNKLSKVHSDMESLHSYVEGEMRRTGMKEEVEQIDELKKSTLKSYVKKASAEAKKAYDYHQMRYGGREGSNPEYMKKTYPAMVAKFDRREAGVEKAKQKLAKEEVEQVDEKAPPGAKYERMVKHIKKGYSKGGLTDKERSIAYATAWKAHNKANEEVEQVDEAIRGYIQSEPGNEDGTAVRRPADQAERDQLARNLIANRKYNLGKKIGRKSGSVRSNAAGMTPSQKISTALRSPEASKKLDPKEFPYMPKNAKITPFLSKEEAEGKVAVTPKEKSLAAHHGDPKKITYGDVIKARLKSAAAKKMGE
jgi:hypothetical protein